MYIYNIIIYIIYIIYILYKKRLSLSYWVPSNQFLRNTIFIFQRHTPYSRTQGNGFSGIKSCNCWLIPLSKLLKIYSRTQGKRIRCNKLKHSYFPWFCGYFPGHPRSLTYKSGITQANAYHLRHHTDALDGDFDYFLWSNCFLFEMMRYLTENRIYKYLIFKGESRIEPF